MKNILGLFIVLLISSTAYADTLDVSTKDNIVAGSTAAAADVKGAFDNIATWSTNIADDNIKSGAGIAAAKISGTALTLSGTQTVTGDKTFTGTVDITAGVLQGASPIVAEGATADAFETTFAVTDPTADRTITIPDADATILPAASQAEMEAASSTTVAVTPGIAHNHPGVAKAWVVFDGTNQTITDSYNIDTGTGITENAAGDYTIPWDTDFSTADGYVVTGTCFITASPTVPGVVMPQSATLAVGSARVRCARPDTLANLDADLVTVAAFGDQ